MHLRKLLASRDDRLPVGGSRAKNSVEQWQLIFTVRPRDCSTKMTTLLSVVKSLTAGSHPMLVLKESRKMLCDQYDWPELKLASCP